MILILYTILVGVFASGFYLATIMKNNKNATKIVLEKKKKEYDKGTKVRHKTKGMVETVVGICKIKYMGAWVDGVIYEGNDVKTGEPMTFVRVKEDFENNFEVL